MSSRRRERSLTREELLEAALGIVDAEGLAALTMRRLADAVGVEPMSLYYHVPSKEVLLDWTVERMRAEMRLPEPLPDDWARALEDIFVSYRSVLAAHPNMLPLAARRTDPSVPSGLTFIVDHGLALDEAVELYQSLVAFTIGYSLLGSPAIETAWAGLPDELAGRLREWRDDTFSRTLRLIIDGYRAGNGE
jgi:AcrR family transcriptional regulator